MTNFTIGILLVALVILIYYYNAGKYRLMVAHYGDPLMVFKVGDVKIYIWAGDTTQIMMLDKGKEQMFLVRSKIISIPSTISKVITTTRQFKMDGENYPPINEGAFFVFGNTIEEIWTQIDLFNSGEVEKLQAYVMKIKIKENSESFCPCPMNYRMYFNNAY